MEFKVSGNFSVWDFVPKAIFDQYGAKSQWFITKFQVDFAEMLFARFGRKPIINNWKDGGTLENRGFRMPDSTVGAKLSQHKFSRACDVNIPGKSPEEVYEEIKTNFSIYSSIGLTTMEDILKTTGTVAGDASGWTHADCRWTGLSELLIVQP